MTTAQMRLAKLYDEHAPSLFAFLLSLSGQETDARDLLQEVFIKLAGRLDAPAPIRCERAFLFQLCYRAGIDWTRRRNTRARYEDAFASRPAAELFASADDPDTAIFREALGGALLSLPPEQRAVVHLKLWQGLTFEQIGEALDLSANTAASRYRYGLDKLRARLRPIYEELT